MQYDHAVHGRIASLLSNLVRGNAHVAKTEPVTNSCYNVINRTSETMWSDYMRYLNK